MDLSKLAIALQQESKIYLADLKNCESDFKNSVINFLTSDFKRCLLIETWNAKLGAMRVMRVLKHLEKDCKDKSVVNNYLLAKHQMFLSWEQLFSVVASSESVPRFENLLVCEFPQSVTIENEARRVLSKIIDRLNFASSEKVIFITSQKGLFDVYVKELEMRAFLKIDEFKNEFTLAIYSNKIAALRESTSHGHMSEVEELLKNGIDVNITVGSDASTALHVAAENGHKDVVSTLLRNGAKILFNRYKETPLELAAQNGHKDVVLTLLIYRANSLSNKCKEISLLLAARKGHKDVVSVLLANGVDVDIKGSEGWTPLHEAVYNNHNGVTKTLLECNANINARDDSGWTALHRAATKNNVQVVETLLNYKADVGAKTDNYNTPLHIAAIHGNLDVVKTLIIKGADVKVCNKWGETALDSAKVYKSKNVVAFLNTIT